MAFCSNCGAKLENGAKFCPSCGTSAGGTVSAASQQTTVKVGTIRKCPACGVEIPAMTAVCPSCGHEFSDVKIATSVQSFFEKLDQVDQDIYDKENEKESKELAKSPTGGVWGSLMGVDMLAKQRQRLVGGVSSATKRKIALIEGFPIPNSKEDILEFVFLATSRIKKVSLLSEDRDEVKSLNKAWVTKCQQAYKKAKISMSSDTQGLEAITNMLTEANIKL